MWKIIYVMVARNKMVFSLLLFVKLHRVCDKFHYLFSFLKDERIFQINIVYRLWRWFLHLSVIFLHGFFFFNFLMFGKNVIKFFLECYGELETLCCIVYLECSNGTVWIFNCSYINKSIPSQYRVKVGDINIFLLG